MTPSSNSHSDRARRPISGVFPTHDKREQRCHSVLPKKSEKVRKFRQNCLKQAENQWKWPNLGIKKSDFRLKSENWHLWERRFDKIFPYFGVFPQNLKITEIQKNLLCGPVETFRKRNLTNRLSSRYGFSKPPLEVVLTCYFSVSPFCHRCGNTRCR